LLQERNMLSHAELLTAVASSFTTLDLPDLGAKESGKVRDIYRLDGQRVLVTTDRVSAFDRVLGVIPYKGQVLNELSAWWFRQTAAIVPNHVVAVPDPNVTIAREARPLPVEVVVRGYITGVTKTSLWYLYEQGDRRPYGLDLPDGLRQNDPLPAPLITPTTKAAPGGHDERLTREEIIGQGILPADLWEEIEQAALALFGRGQAVARQAGLILVDTKYEFGLVDGRLTLIDELHTPDSSRYWSLASFERGEPENFDKEYLRAWFAGQGYWGDGEPPAMPDEFVAQVAARYIAAYEQLTGQPFTPGEQPVAARIARNLQAYFDVKHDDPL
jgi:phosphoribosylaminoimidazole-succinocarboxamide synthase